MARVKLPCFSIEAHGSIGNGIVFATNQWGQYVKFFFPRSKKPTAAQIKVRNAYGEVASSWRGLTQEQKDSYHEKAARAGITDCNQHFKEEWPNIYV